MAELKFTITPSGQGGDYTSLEACLDDNEQDLTDGGGDYFLAEIDGDWSSATDTTPVLIDGWTTAADNYISVYTTSAARHSGILSTDYYLLDTTAGHGIDIDESYVRIEGLQILIGGFNHSGIKCDLGAGAGEVRISHNIIKGNYSGANNFGYGIFTQDFAPTYKIWNNIIYDIINGSQSSMRGIYRSDGNSYIYNNTIHNCYTGILSFGFRARVFYNNIVQDCSTEDYASTGGDGYTGRNNIGNLVVSEGAWGDQADSGGTSSTSSFQLIDRGKSFETTCKVGMVIHNTSDNTYTYITSIIDNETLGVADDIFVALQTYTIYHNKFGDVTFENEGSDDFHLGSGDTFAKDNWYNVYGDGDIAVIDDIDGDARPNDNTGDIGADEFVSSGQDIAIAVTTLPLVVPNTTTTKGAITPDIAVTVLNFIVPSVGVTKGGINVTVAPSALNLSVPDITATIGGLNVAIAPTALSLNVPDVTVTLGGLDIAVAPSLLSLNVPDIKTTFDIKIAPTILNLVVPEITITSGLVVLVAPTILNLDVPDIGVTLGGLNVAVDISQLPLIVPDVTATKGSINVGIAPTVLNLSVPDVGVSAGQAIAIAPTVLNFNAPDVGVTHGSINVAVAATVLPLVVPGIGVTYGGITADMAATALSLLVPDVGVSAGLVVNIAPTALNFIVPDIDVSTGKKIATTVLNLVVPDIGITLGEKNVAIAATQLSLLVPAITVLPGTLVRIAPTVLELLVPPITGSVSFGQFVHGIKNKRFLGTKITSERTLCTGIINKRCLGLKIINKRCKGDG